MPKYRQKLLTVLQTPLASKTSCYPNVHLKSHSIHQFIKSIQTTLTSAKKKQTQHLRTCHPKWRGVFQPSCFRCPYVFFSRCEGTLLEYLESCPFLASPSFFVLHLARPPKQVCHWAATAQSLRRPRAHGNCCNSQRVRGTFFSLKLTASSPLKMMLSKSASSPNFLLAPWLNHELKINCHQRLNRRLSCSKLPIRSLQITLKQSGLFEVLCLSILEPLSYVGINTVYRMVFMSRVVVNQKMVKQRSM